MDLLALRADTIRKTGVYKARYLITGLLFDRTFRPIITMRLCQASGKSKYLGRIAHLFFRLLHRWACQKAGIDFSWNTTIGPGFTINHGWGMVVNRQAIIGKNVTLFNGVTIGRRDRIARDGKRQIEYPIIEDEVWVGPHATIAGGVTVVRGSRIAAGAFVIESVPAYSTVVGNPGTIVKSNTVPDVHNPAP